MLSQESFNGLSKAQLYNIYTELYRRTTKEQIIDYVKRSSMGNTGSQFSYHKVTGNKANYPEKERTLKVILLPERTGNLILGSSIVKNMVGDRTILTNIVTHAYQGSTTSEKIQILDQYPNREMTTVVLQDGTNTIVKNKDKPIDEIFNEYQVLLDKVREKFSPDILIALEVQPMKNDPRNTSKNSKIQEFKLQRGSFFEKLLLMLYALLMVEYKIQPPREIIKITTTGRTDEHIVTIETTGSRVTTTRVTECRANGWKCSMPRNIHLNEEELVFFSFVRNLIFSPNLKRSVYALHFNYFRHRET